MALTSLWTLGGIDLDGTDIDQVQNTGVDPGIQEMLEGGDGSVFDTFIAVGSQIPVLNFETTKIAAALGAAGLTGANISTAVNAYVQKTVQGGTRATGSNHGKLAITDGFIRPTTLSLPNSQENRFGTIGYDITAISSDGSTAPLGFTTGQALGVTSAVDEGFVAGPCSINGTALDGVVGITIDFGIEIEVIAVDGDVYGTYIWIIRVRSTITIDVLDLGLFATGGTIGPGGVVQGATDSILYGRKVAAGGTRVANATAEHLKFTIAAGRHKISTIQAGHAGRATAAIVIMPTDNGSDDYIAVSTGSAIV